MQSRRPLFLYTGVTLLAGLLVAGACLLHYPIAGTAWQWLLFAALVLLTAVSECFGLHLASGLRVYVDTIPLFAGLLIFNPAMVVLLATLGYVFGRLPQRGLILIERVFNLSQTLVYVGAGALALQIFTRTPWQPTGWQSWAGLLAAIVVMYLLNTGLIAGILAVQRQNNALQIWLKAVPLDLLEQAIMYAFGLLMALLVAAYPWAMFLLVAPAAAVFMALDRSLQMQAKQRQLAEQNAGLAAHLSAQTAQLREASAELQDAVDAKNQLLQNVSHELRTPLVSICGYTEALQEGLYGELALNQCAALGVVYRNAQQMTRLVNDLLSLQTIDRSHLQLSNVAVPQLLQNVATNFQQRAECAGIHIGVDCADGLPHVRADAARLEQVISNLVDNAIKFSPQGGEIALRAQALDESRLEISVKDHGIGIPQVEIAQIYLRFYQVDGSSTRRYGGQGLGLAIAKRIVELHGGEIRAESEAARGTTFFVTLPVAVSCPVPELAEAA